MTEQLHFHFSLSCIGEGNGNPLQCSCLENPRDEEAWWAAVYGVAQSRTQLKQLNSSSYIPINHTHTKKRLKITDNLISSVQLLSCVRLFAAPWSAACQASLSITNSWSLLKLMSIVLVMPSKHLILCLPLLPLPSIFLIIRVFSRESILRIRCPKYCSFSFSINPSNEHPGLISFRMD